MQGAAFPLIVTGAGGRVGRLLRAVMPARRVTWVTRSATLPDDMTWAQLLEHTPEGAVIVHLAGSVRGDLSLNTVLAQQVCALPSLRHVFVASTAAVYAAGPENLREDMRPRPQSAYGAAKLAMEQAVLADGVTALRIGNVAGADALLGGLVPEMRCVLDPVPGQKGGPHRSYIGPVTLGRVLMRLAEMADAGDDLPSVLNVAASGSVAMADLLTAANADWCYGTVRDDVVPRVVLDVGLLHGIIPMQDATAQDIVAEWRAVR